MSLKAINRLSKLISKRVLLRHLEGYEVGPLEQVFIEGWGHCWKVNNYVFHGWRVRVVNGGVIDLWSE